jgi:hypothetical protein
MKNADLLAKRPPDNEQRFDQNSQIRQVLDKLLDARLEPYHFHHAHLEAEVTQSPRRSLSMAMALDCSSLRCVSSIRSFLCRERVDELARLMTLEMGKRISEGREEVELCARIFEYYAHRGEEFLRPQTLPSPPEIARHHTGRPDTSAGTDG